MQTAPQITTSKLLTLDEIRALIQKLDAIDPKPLTQAEQRGREHVLAALCMQLTSLDRGRTQEHHAQPPH